MVQSYHKTVTLSGTTPVELLDRAFSQVTFKVTGAGTIAINGGEPITLATGAVLDLQADGIRSAIATPAASSGFTSIEVIGLAMGPGVPTQGIVAVENPCKVKDPVQVPKPNVAPGVYSATQSVKLTTETPGATIYYTVDGSTPTAESTQYSSSAIAVAKTTTIKAIAIKKGLRDSAIVEYTYIIKAAG